MLKNQQRWGMMSQKGLSSLILHSFTIILSFSYSLYLAFSESEYNLGNFHLNEIKLFIALS